MKLNPIEMNNNETEPNRTKKKMKLKIFTQAEKDEKKNM